LGEHDTEEEARAQVRALFANEGKADDKEKPMKTEADGKHPAGHYLVVEDPEKPSTWHLRVRDMNGDPDHRLMGAAWAALHGGYRGNVYEGPSKEEAIRKLRAMYAAEEMDTPDKDKAKSISLSDEMEKVDAAFYRMYGNPYGPNQYWTREIFDTHVIVSCTQMPFPYYQVSYSENEVGEIIFAPIGEWIGGDYVFVANQKSKGINLEFMSGRRVRADKIELIHELESLLSRFKAWAEYADEEQEEEPAKEADKPKDNESGSGTIPPVSKKDGSGVTPPTSEELLRLIEIEEEELSLLR
jgi:hypothetical protein